MDTAHASNEKIAEALKLLEEAARDKKDEIRHLVSDKYVHLKSVLGDAGHSTAARLTAAEERTLAGILHAKEVGAEKIRQAGAAVDKQAHANPWPCIGGAALTAFLFGYVLGRKK